MEPFEKEKFMYDLQNNQITPYDRFQYIQCINNPLQINNSTADEIITVQACKTVLKFSKNETQQKDYYEIDERDFYPVCISSTDISRCLLKYTKFDEKEENKKKCFYCEQYFSDYFTCNHSFFSCADCNRKCYLRNKLKDKSSKHFTYERYVLKATLDETQNIKEEEINTDIKLKDAHKLLEHAKTTAGYNDETVEASLFAELVPEKDFEMPIQKHVLVGFWRNDQEVGMNCYQIVRVENPIIFYPSSDDECQTNIFLLKAENGDIYYFNKGEDGKISLNILDLKANMKGENLEHLTSNIDKPKVKETILITNHDIQSLLFSLIQKSGNQKQPPSLLAMPQLITFNGYRYLIIVNKVAKQELQESQRFDSINLKIQIADKLNGATWRETSYRNLFFIKMTEVLQQIEFTIYDASLFLKLYKEKDPFGSNREYVWFVRNKSVCVMDWGAPVWPQDYSKQDSESIKVPYQDVIRQYIFSPQDEAYPYDQEYDEIHQRFQKLLDREFMMNGHIHCQDKRLSINFQHGGLFAFELVDGLKNSVPGKWHGEIGIVKGISLDRLQWNQNNQLEGVWYLDSDKKQQYMVEGKIDSSQAKWIGFCELNKVKIFIIYDDFKISKKGIITGNGQFSFMGNIIVKYNIQGKLEIDTGAFNFQETTSINGISEKTIFVRGKMQEDRSMFWGRWSTKQKFLDNEGEIFCAEMFRDKNIKIKLNLRVNPSTQTQGNFSTRQEKSLLGYSLDCQFDQITQTIIGKDRNNQKCEFYAIQHRSRAICWIQQTNLDDGSFFQTEGQLYFAGNIRENTKEDIKIPTGYRSMILDAINLDSDKTELIDHQKQNFLLPSFFRNVSDEFGNIKLPARLLMPINLQKNNDQQISSFTGQMFYFDPLNKRSELIFLFANVEYKEQNQLPRWPAFQSDDIKVQYPLLFYKTQLPTNNEIVIVNLIKNEPQKILNIYPYTFVQFIDVGFNPERWFISKKIEQNVNSCVFFIVQHKGIHRIMYYKVFPFPLETTEMTEGLKIDDSIYILSGQFDINQIKDHMLTVASDDNPLRYTHEKIVAASLLHKPTLEGVQIMVVLQLFDGIVYFSLNEKLFNTFEDVGGTTMISLLMQRGPYEEIYFGERNKQTGDSIVCLSFKAKRKLQKECVAKLNGQNLLALQILNQNEFDSENFKNHTLTYIDSSQQYIFLDFTNSSVEPIVAHVMDLKKCSKIENIMNHLQLNPWSRICGDIRGFTMLLDKNSRGKNGRKLITGATSLSIQSRQVYSLEAPQFSLDYQFERQKNKKSQINLGQNEINAVMQMPWMQKIIYEVKDYNFNYFLISNSKFSRKISLMMPDQLGRLMGTLSKIFIGNLFIAVPIQQAEQYILFSQKDLSYVTTIKYSNLAKASPIQNGVQHFFATGDSEKRKRLELVKVSQDSQQIFQILIKDVKQTQKQYIQYLASTFQINIPDEDAHKVLNYSKDNLIFILPMYEQFNYNRNDPISSSTKSLTGNLINVYMFKLETEDVKCAQNSDCYVFHSKYLEDEMKKYNCRMFLKFTKNYLLIYVGVNIYFHKFESMDFKTFSLEVMKDQDVLPFQFQMLNFKEFFNPSNTNNGIRVQSINQNDLFILEKNEIREDVIQISFSNLTIVWDLAEKENKEVAFVENPHHFSTQESYVNCGIVPHLFKMDKQMKNAKFLSTNERRELIIKPSLNDTGIETLFTTYCEQDLIDISYIKSCELKDIGVNRIDFETILATFNGLTFFEIFKTNADYMELIKKQIDEQELVQQVTVDVSGNTSDNILIRRLLWTLLLPTFSEKIEKRNNLLQTMLSQQEIQYMLDPLLNLVMLSEEKKLSNLVCSIDSFKKVFNTKSQTIGKFLSDSLFSNEQTHDVKFLKWNLLDNIISFGSQTSQLSPAQIIKYTEQQQLQKAPIKSVLKAKLKAAYHYLKTSEHKDVGKLMVEKNSMVPVEVKILEIEWLDEQLSELYTYMSKLEDNTLFGNSFIRLLLEQQNYTNQIILKVFLPFLLYTILFFYYVTATVVNCQIDGFFDTSCSTGSNNNVWIRFLIIIMAAIFLGIEIMQIKTSKSNYFGDFWNYLYLSSILLNIFIVIESSTHFVGINYNKLVGTASVAVVLQWSVMYYWTRLFASLAFFVTFLSEVINDIAAFLVMFLICIFMFGHAIYILSQSYKQPRYLEGLNENSSILDISEIPPTFSDTFGLPFLDSLLAQYSIAIGNANTDGYQSYQPLLWIYYIATTLWTQLTFFNMLIGIMGQTFERVTEGKQRNSLMERTKMYGDFIWAIKLSKQMQGRYLYIIKPITEEDENAVEGSILSLKRQLQFMERNLEKELQIQQSKICTEVADFSLTHLKNLTQKVEIVQSKVNEFSSQVNDIKSHIDAKFNNVEQKYDYIIQLLGGKVQPKIEAEHLITNQKQGRPQTQQVNARKQTNNKDQ